MNGNTLMIFIGMILSDIIWMPTSGGSITYGENRYSLENERVSWSEARNICAEKNSTLASLHELELNLIIAKLISSSGWPDLWIGLYLPDEYNTCSCNIDPGGPDCQACRNNWRWVDGSNLTMQFWFYNEPTRFERCGRLTRHNDWAGRSCSGLYGFICQTHLCDDISCEHGNCRVQNIEAFCECDLGFTGQYCETDIDECSSDPCQNKGNCYDDVNSFTCGCANGYSGQLCEQKDALSAQLNKQKKGLLIAFIVGSVLLVISLVLLPITIYFYINDPYRSSKKKDNMHAEPVKGITAEEE